MCSAKKTRSTVLRMATKGGLLSCDDQNLHRKVKATFLAEERLGAKSQFTA
jgi:hypothetical protein